MEICQVFFEKASGRSSGATSQFDLRRRPVVGKIEVDETLEKLREPI